MPTIDSNGGINTTDNTSSNTTSITAPNGISDGKLVVKVCLESATDVSTITYNGVSLTFVTGSDQEQGAQRSESWYLDSPANDGMAHDLVTTLDASVTRWYIGWIFLADADTGQLEAVATSSATTATTISTNITTVANNALVIDGASLSIDKTASFTYGTDQTQFFSEGDGGSTASGTGSTKTVVSAGATSMTISWSGNTQRVTHSVVSIAPAAVSGLSIPVAMHNYRQRRVGCI